MAQNPYNLNQDPDFFEKIIKDTQLNSTNFLPFISWLDDFVEIKMNIDDSSLSEIPLYLPDETQSSNQKRAFEQSHLWLNHEMDQTTKLLHLKLMKNIMAKSLAKLFKRYPEIVYNAEELTSLYLMKDKPAQYRTKLLTHQDDWLIAELYPELKLPFENKKEFSAEQIDTMKLLTLLLQQVMNFIDHPTTQKKFGFTITSRTISGKLIPWYRPVIICRHKPSNFCCMIDINNLVSTKAPGFNTGFALDEYQVKACDLFQFVGPRNSDLRVFDDIVRSIDFNEIINKTVNLEDIYLPPSFIEFRNLPLYEDYCNLIEKLEKLN